MTFLAFLYNKDIIIFILITILILLEVAFIYWMWLQVKREERLNMKNRM